jgi:hypothetical protein
MEGARARGAKRSARGKRSVYAAKGPGARARGATVRTTGEGRMRCGSASATTGMRTPAAVGVRMTSARDAGAHAVCLSGIDRRGCGYAESPEPWGK